MKQFKNRTLVTALRYGAALAGIILVIVIGICIRNHNADHTKGLKSAASYEAIYDTIEKGGVKEVMNVNFSDDLTCQVDENGTKVLITDGNFNDFIKGFHHIIQLYRYNSVLIIVDEDSGKDQSTVSFYRLEGKHDFEKMTEYTQDGKEVSTYIMKQHFYLFTKYPIPVERKKDDIQTYVPRINDTCIEEDNIIIQQEKDLNCYFVVSYVDLTRSLQMIRSKAFLCENDMFFINQNLENMIH